jgi:hypothetical protein
MPVRVGQAARDSICSDRRRGHSNPKFAARPQQVHDAFRLLQATLTRRGWDNAETSKVRCVMRFLPVLVAAVVCACCSPPPSRAATALFWVSDSADDPKGPAAATISAPQGQTRTLYIWAQPAPGRILESFSLDLAIPAFVLEESGIVPVVDFLDGELEFNPCVVNCQTTNEQKRFEAVYDSFGAPPFFKKLTSNVDAASVLGGAPDGLGGFDDQFEPKPGLQGLTLAASGYVGIGHPNDPLKRQATNGPAWLVASVGFQTVRSAGTNPYYLQIGEAGMLHQGDATAAGTDVVFGDLELPSTMYNAGDISKRHFTDANDRYDFEIIASDPMKQGDYDGDEHVDSDDFNYWRKSYGRSVAAGAGADGNGNGTVDAADYIIWRKSLLSIGGSGDSSGRGAEMRRADVPEPSSMAFASILAMLLFARLRLPLRSNGLEIIAASLRHYGLAVQVPPGPLRPRPLTPPPPAPARGCRASW